jgi:2,4-dienoyl-CoA reductase-like NADH-dependent reductase (Old Yellow Enzyme family)
MERSQGSSAAAFLAEIEAFLARERAAPSGFGRAAVGDPNFVRDLRDGRAPSLRLVDRARAYMARAARDATHGGCADAGEGQRRGA